MAKVILYIIVFTFISGPAFCGETIYAKETNSFFYQNSLIKQYKGQFENTYLLEGNKIIRTRVYNLKTKEIIPDNTIYTIHSGLASDPNIAISGKNPIIRALGQPGTDAIEILVIDFKSGYIDSIKSTADYIVISHYIIVR